MSFGSSSCRYGPLLGSLGYDSLGFLAQPSRSFIPLPGRKSSFNPTQNASHCESNAFPLAGLSEIPRPCFPVPLVSESFIRVQHDSVHWADELGPFCKSLPDFV